jgi:RimJ/RimL family protein N-acetyltransferase
MNSPSPARELATSRLLGIPLARGHGEELHQLLYSDPEVMATLGGGTRTLEQVQAGIETFLAHRAEHGFSVWVFRSRDSGPLVGLGGMMFYDIAEGRVPGLIYHIARDSWGQGYATEIAREVIRFGFENLGLEAIYSWTLPTNLPSQRVMEKCGMRRFREGTFKNLPHVFYRTSRVGT